MVNGVMVIPYPDHAAHDAYASRSRGLVAVE